ncbi:MAG: class II aldolase/adducin family protein [Spirochaetia bacterium]
MEGQTPKEGVVKFTVKRMHKTPPLAQELYKKLDEYRDKLWKKGLIGFDQELGVGYGNISRRIEGPKFIITATQTGHLKELTGGHYTIVERADFSGNSVSASGPSTPSSEALTHAAFYTREDIHAVIHIHSMALWKKLKSEDTLSTEENIPYGSKELYTRIMEILGSEDLKLPVIIVIKGHKEGVFAAGKSLDQAYRLLISYIEE